MTNSYEKGIEYCKKALPLNQELKDQLSLAKDLANIGTAYSYLGLKRKSNNNLLKAIQILDTIGENYEKMPWLGNLAGNYYDSGKYKEAAKYYREALDLAIEQQNTWWIISYGWGLSNSLEQMSKISEAINILEIVYQYEQIYDPDHAEVTAEKIKELRVKQNN